LVFCKFTPSCTYPLLKSGKLTAAVTFLTEILENAKVQKDKKGNQIFDSPKSNLKNQAHFSKIFIMYCEKAAFRKIKLTVGEYRGSRNHTK
jgi:hypothetical protein